MRISVSPQNLDNSNNTNELSANPEKIGTESGQQFSLYSTLLELSKEKKMYFLKPQAYVHYIPPRLTKGKTWYISYYVKNPETGKMKRFRIKLNRFHNLKERMAAARGIMASVGEKLSLGWNPMIDDKAPKAYTSLFHAMDDFLATKGKELEPNSMRSYTSLVKILKDWLKRIGFNEETYASQFAKEHAVRFMADVDSDSRLSPRTYNNYLTFSHCLFEWMLSHGYVSANPFNGLHKKPKRLTKKNRRLIKDSELDAIFGFLKENNPEYLAICLLCYGCFIRPKEIALLKCEDIDLKRQVVHIKASIAKNDNDSFRTIPDELMPSLQRLDYSNPTWYLFGDHSMFDFTPGPKLVCSRKFAKYWDYIRKECDLPMEVQFYSLKDTGITNMLNSGVPINQVQKQADHSSVAVTAIYVGKTPEANSQLKAVDILNKK